MKSKEVLLELGDIVEMSEEQKQQLTAMVSCAYVGDVLDTSFIEENIDAYSALNSKAILVVINNVVSKDIGQKAVKIVAFIRSKGKAKEGVKLLDVLGKVKPRTPEDVKAIEKQLEAWRLASAEVEEVDLEKYDLSTDEGFNEAIDALVSRNEKIAKRAEQLKQEAERKELEDSSKDAYASEEDAVRREVLAGAVNEAVATILKRYATLYADLFVNPAMGVITSRGILGAASDNSIRVKHTSSLVLSCGIYKVLQDLLGDLLIAPVGEASDTVPADSNGVITSGLFNYDGTSSYTYLPKLQAQLVSGIHRQIVKSGGGYKEAGGLVKSKSYASFISTIKDILTCDISKIVNKVFEDDKDIMECLVRLNTLKDTLIRQYTTTIIAEEVVPNKVIRIRVSCLGAENQLSKVSSSLLGAGNVVLGTDVASAEELNNSVTDGVLKLTLSLDKEAFTQETLFAYEALERVYESGNTVDMGKIVVGRKLSGELMSINLASPGSVVLSVQGAGRSGKGVLTLSMLATMVGSGCPFIYLDNKPDMAALLWQLEREYGTKILSIDITGKTSESVKTVGGGSKIVSPVRRGTAYNIPENFSNDMYWSAFAYAKLATLYTLAMHCKGTGKIPELDKLPLFFAVFDEASSTSKVLQKNYIEVMGVLKNDKNNEEALQYKAFLEALGTGLGAIFSNYPDRGLKILVLSQSWNTETWKDTAADGKTPQMFYPLLYGASMRILGTDNTGAQQNALGESTAPGKNLISPETMGHFAFVPKNRAEKGNVIDVFKSYLVLNDNDFDTSGKGQHGKYVGGMLSNLKSKPAVYEATSNKIAPDNVLESRIGFSGLLNYIGDKGGVQVAETLGVGYRIMDAVAALVGITGEGGRYNDIEDWLYDCTPETFWSYAKLKNLVDSGERVPNGLGSDGGEGAVVFDDAPEMYASTDTFQEPKSEANPMDEFEEVLSDGPVDEFADDYANPLASEQTPREQGFVEDADGVDSAITPRDVEQLRRAVAEGQPLHDTFVQKGTVTGMKEFLSKYWDLDEYLSKVKPFEILPEHKELVSDFHRLYAFCSDKYRRSVELDQPQEQPKQQLFHINGMAFVLGDDGNFHYHSGRLAPLHNVPPGTFQGEARATAPSIDQNSGQMPFNDVNGERVISDPNSLQYAQMLDEPEVMFKRKVKPITHDMPQAKFEKAMTQRWKILLTAAAKSVGGAGLVATLGISESALFVNGVRFHPPAGLLDEAGLKVTDIIDYDMTFRTFKQLKQLDLDYPAYASFSASYSNPAVPFTKHKTLQAIVFTHSDGRRVPYTRANASERLNLPVDKLHSNFNTWTAMSSQVNKGSTSSFCKPGTRLIMADYTKRLAVGAFGPNSSWSTRRKALGFIGMLFTGAATVVTGGVQAARASVRQK